MPSHRISCYIPYRRDQIFDLAADVERYPDFLPWWAAARVWKREGNVYYTDQVIHFATVRKRLKSKTVLQRPERIDVISSDGAVRNLHLTWLFSSRPRKGCQVSLTVDLELRSQLLQNLFAHAMIRAVGPIMSAFKARAHRLYDPMSCDFITPGEPSSGDTMI
jgi:coenzyme Q-binding protein COQ10